MVFLLCHPAAFSQSVIPVEKATTAPIMDGLLDDPVWSSVPRYSDFTNYTPQFGIPASFRTISMITYDDENFYVAFDCKDPEPDKIKATISARDQIKTEDWVCINLDPFFDQQSLVTLYINPLGIQADGRSTASNEDMGADYVFYSQGTITSEGYQIEIRVPFKSLRYQKKEPVRMGFILERRIQRLSEQSTCPPLSPEQGMNFLTQTQGFSFTGIKHYTLVEVLPAFTYSRRKTHENGAFSLTTNTPSLSLTGKLGLTSQLILDLTLNPDFSQVESDAGQIEENQRYALYYDEKRPFFQEGQENFEIAGGNENGFYQTIFHTRQITNPLAGLKLSGKLSPKSRIALLYSLDDPFAGTDSAGSYSNFIIGRFHQTIKNDTYIGAITTFKERSDGFNRVAGFDGRVRIDPSITIDFNLLGSSTQARETSVAENDWMGTVVLSKNSSKLNGSAQLQHIGHGFVTESGFLRRSGYDQFLSEFSYTLYRNSGFFRRVSPNIFLMLNHDLPSGLWERDLGLGLSMIGERSTSLSFYLNPCDEVYLNQRFKTHAVFLNGYSQVAKSLRIVTQLKFGYQTRYVENPYTGLGSRGSLSLIYQPAQKFQSQLDLTYSDFYQISGDQEFSYLIIRTKNTFQINAKLFIRAIVEYNSFEKDLSYDLLASFTYIPGTVVHIGYGSLFQRTEWNGHEYQPGSEYLETRRGFFFKASYLWRN
jgi:hypothetical protein